MRKTITENPGQTKKIGFKLAHKLKKGDVLALIGDLGSGKTTFIQGLARGLGIKKHVLSPSFVFLKPYPVKKRGVGYFYHFDLYRLQSPKQLLSAGLSEYLNAGHGIVAIEWADKIIKMLPPKTIKVRFDIIGRTRRKISC